jgi:hypothetical protein
MKFIEDNNKSILADYSWNKKYPRNTNEQQRTTDNGHMMLKVKKFLV